MNDATASVQPPAKKPTTTEQPPAKKSTTTEQPGPPCITMAQQETASSSKEKGAVQRGFAAKGKSPVMQYVETASPHTILGLLLAPLLLVVYLVLGRLATTLLVVAAAPQVVSGDSIKLKVALAKLLRIPLGLYIRTAGAETADAKRRGILAGYKKYADKRGISWSGEAAQLEGRGMATWEEELAQNTNKALVIPEYYDKHGVGTLHSYVQGNTNWPAAFDAPSAYLLVHCHHYPQLGAQEGFDELHADFERKVGARGGVDAGATVSTVVDVGCGVGTSTFALRKALDATSFGEGAVVTGVDLSPHFVTVAKFRAAGECKELCEGDKIRFQHGDGTDLVTAGFEPGSVDVVVMSEVTHEMPTKAIQAVMRSIFQALRPGGVLGYMDLNADQIVKDCSVYNLTSRLAMSNEPYLDQYSETSIEQTMLDAGFADVTRSWPNSKRYKSSIECSLRTIVATKPY